MTDALAQGPDAAEQLVASFTNDHLLVATDGEVYRWGGGRVQGHGSQISEVN